MEQEETISFMEKPIEGLPLWLIALSPFLLIVLIFGLLLSGDFYLSFLELIVQIVIGGVIMIVLFSPLVGLSQGLPNWAYPATGFVIGILSLILFAFWGLQIDFLPDKTRFASELVYEIIDHSHYILLIVCANYTLSALVILLAVFVRSLMTIVTNARRNLLGLSFLFYCSTIFVPILGIFIFWVFEALPIMILGYLLLGLGAWAFLRFTKPGQKYLALLASILLGYGLYSLWIFRLFQLNPSANHTDLPFWGPAVVVAIEGIVILVLIALPAALELFLHLRSIMNEEVPATD